jgi:signal transduction histidine kinase
MIFTYYSLIYLLTAVASFIVAFLAIQRKIVIGAWELFFLGFAVSESSYFSFFESMCVSPDQKVFWSAMSYFGGATIPVFYLLFVLRFTELLKFKEIRLGCFLFLYPIITIVLAFTNEYHHLFWSGFSPIDPQTNAMLYVRGAWFWIGFVMYNYLILSIATFYLFRFLYRNRKKRVYKKQGILLAVGGLVPWLASLIYIFDIGPFEGLKISPISMFVGAIFFTNAILKNSFMNQIPVARETLVETLPLGVLALDEQNRIQDINEFARKFLNINKKEVLGTVLKTHVCIPEKLIPVLLSRKSPVEIEHEINGVKYYYIVSKTSVQSIPGFRILTIQDITEQILRQKELEVARVHAEESDRLKSAFLANMSHEIRTPMNGIMGFVSLLNKENLTTEERGQYLEIVSKNCIRLLNTLNDIIDLSKIEAGQMLLNASEIDLQEFIYSISERFQTDAMVKNLDFRVAYSFPKENLIMLDKIKLYSIVSNLMKNAIKYTNEGFVFFECVTNDTSLFMKVMDSGIGIPESKQSLIFERFVQADNFSNKVYEGVGLGLSITKAYVDMMGGSISLQSQEGIGSEFVVEIPLLKSDTSF